MPKEIIFRDTHGIELFRLPNGSSIKIIHFNGKIETKKCKYVDSEQMSINGNTFKIETFVKVQTINGNIFAPIGEEPSKFGYYEIYQIEDTENVEYAFRPFPLIFNSWDYKRSYAGMLSPEISLEGVFYKHNGDIRPFANKMRSLSVSDIIVLHSKDGKKAYYVERTGFRDISEYFQIKIPDKTKEKDAPPHEER